MIKTLSGLMVMLFTLAGTAMAQQDGPLRVTLLTEQALRTLRIAKSTCFVMSGSESQLHANATLKEARQFEGVMQALIEGAAKPALGAEPDPKLKIALLRIQQMSFGFTRSASQIVSGDFHSVPMRLVLSRNQDVSDALLAAARDTGPRYPDHKFSKEQQAALHHLAAQRVLVEELLRDLCYLRLAVGAADLAAAMRDKIAHFETVNIALIDGDPARGLPKAPNLSIKIALGQVASKWVSLRRPLVAASGGAPLDLRDLQLASVIGETLNLRLAKLMEKYAGL
jgi:hypothetical protein